MKPEIKRLLVLLFLVAIPLYLVWSSDKSYEMSVYIYVLLAAVVILMILNIEFFTKQWYLGLGIFVFFWLMVNNPEFQSQFIVMSFIAIGIGLLLSLKKLQGVIA